MFPAKEKELSKNPFFQAWKESSIFELLVGIPPILIQEFSQEWAQKLIRMIGEGPLTSRFLSNLAEYIGSIRSLNGYTKIKERLARLDEQFYPTLSEIEFLWFILRRMPSQLIHLEYTFKGPSRKNPELRIDLDTGPVYFEVTAVEEYKQMNLILQYFNIITAFQLSLMTLHKLNRQIVVEFPEHPTEETLRRVSQTINKRAAQKQFLFKDTNPDYTVTMTEGDKVKFDMPTDFLEKKIKDKIDEKTAKFRVGDPSFIVIDVTPMVTDLETQFAKIREYFQYSQNRTVWGVLLQSKWWAFEDMQPVYKHAVICQGNSLINGKKSIATISKILPRPS